VSEQLTRQLLLAALIVIFGVAVILVGQSLATDWWDAQAAQLSRKQSELVALQSATGNVEELQAELEIARGRAADDEEGRTDWSLLDVGHLMTDIERATGATVSRFNPGGSSAQPYVEYVARGSLRSAIRLLEELYRRAPELAVPLVTVESGPSQVSIVVRVAHE
jgi:hypothetical protein